MPNDNRFETNRLSAVEVATSLCGELNNRGVVASLDREIANNGFRIEVRPSDGVESRKITVYVLANGKLSKREQPLRIDPAYNRLVQQAWDAVRSALNSPSRVLTAAQRNYVNQIDILLEEWVQFREAKFAIDWTELREAVRDLLSEAGISAPEPMDMSIEDNEPTAWRAAFSGISGK